MANQLDSLNREFGALSLNNRRRNVPAKKRHRKVQLNTRLFNFRAELNKMDSETIVEYRVLRPNNRKYIRIEEDLPEYFHSLEISEVINPFISMSFKLKQEFKYGNMSPKRLYHGTKLKYLDSICTDNFDWRFSGSSREHKHGYGVNFTADPHFAASFCGGGRKKVLILAHVLVKNCVIGTSEVRILPEGYDTATRKDGRVYVKFEDAEFCPRFIITFKTN